MLFTFTWRVILHKKFFALCTLPSLLYGAVLDSKVRSHFIIIHLYASDLVCAPKLLHNLCLFGCLFFNQSGYITADITAVPNLEEDF